MTRRCPARGWPGIAIVTLAVLVGATNAGAQAERKPVVRVFPLTFCPQDFRQAEVRFTATLSTARLTFEAHSRQPRPSNGYWDAAAFNLDNVVVIPSSILWESSGPVPNYTNCYEGSPDCPATYLDAIPGAVAMDLFDEGPGAWSLDFNTRWVPGSAPRNTRTGQDASGGSLEFRVLDSGTQLMRASRTLTGLTPTVTYSVTFWWSALDEDTQLWVLADAGTAVPADGWSDVTPGGLTCPMPAQSVIWTDSNADGREDLLVTGVEEEYLNSPYTSESYLLEQGPGGFARSEAPFPGNGATYSGALSADMDGDGDLDLAGLATSRNFPSSAVQLSRRDAGGFVTVPDIATGNSVSAADVNRDGSLDIVSGPVVTLRTGSGGGAFGPPQEVIDGADHNRGGGMAWGDMDGDGDLDLYVTSCRWRVRMFEDVNEETCDFKDGLLLNANGTLVVVTDASGLGAHNVQGMSADWGDHDGDGDLDLAVTGGNCLYGLKIFNNNGAGFFTDATPAGLQCVCTRSDVAWADLDNDGDLDLLLSSVTGANRFVRNDGGGSWTTVYPAAWQGIGVTAGAAPADFDHDGDLDVAFAVRARGESPLENPVPRNGYDAPAVHSRLFRNDLSSGARWLELVPVCGPGFRSPIGTHVTMWAAGRRQTRQLDGGHGAWGQEPDVVHFGLGTATVADSVVIRWPSGFVQRIGQLASNQRVVVPEGNFSTAVSPAAQPELRVGELTSSPNPQRGGATIRFRARPGARPTLRLVDVSGRVRRDLSLDASGEGEQRIEWNGGDEFGTPLSPGVYFLVMRDGADVSRRTIVLLR